MKEIKVLEWNINQRGGFGKGEIPYWIKDEIEAADADIVVLTEFCTQCDGRTKFINDLKYLKYQCVTSENSGGNDILIGVKSHLKIKSCSWMPCYAPWEPRYDENRAEEYVFIPENLSVDIDCDGTTLKVIGMRIKTKFCNSIRCEELAWVLGQVNNTKVLITGDFNNYKRSYADTRDKKDYNISVIDKILKETYPGYVRNTPDGASWGEDVKTEYDPCYALDHFITKGISIKEGTLKYDRSFVDRDKGIYQWDKSCQEMCSSDAKPEDLSHVNPPFPDHAILKGTFILE